jgi:predicted adenylyl cyclase CyaB
MKLNELEIKIKVGTEKQFQETFELCTKLYGPPTSHVLQLDEYYDSPDCQLLNQDLVLRIRSVDNEKMVALKSPRLKLPNGMTKRIELEFASSDGKKVQDQLKDQGLVVRQSSEKERWTFTYKDIEILFDRLPFIGTYIEIEGPTTAAIQKIVDVLKLNSNTVIQKNYGELMRAKFLELGLPLENMHATFKQEKLIMSR